MFTLSDLGLFAISIRFAFISDISCFIASAQTILSCKWNSIFFDPCVNDITPNVLSKCIIACST